MAPAADWLFLGSRQNLVPGLRDVEVPGILSVISLRVPIWHRFDHIFSKNADYGYQ